MERLSYNIKNMRDVLLKARSEGNSRVISRKFCVDNGVSEAIFAHYQNKLSALYLACTNAYRIQRSHTSTDEDRQSAMSSVFEAWKDLLSIGACKETKALLHANPTDANMLVELAGTYLRDLNGVYQYSEALNRRFVKSVEIELGLRFAQAAVISNHDRDIIVAVRKLNRKVKRAQDEIQVLEDLISRNKKEMSTNKDDSRLTELTEENNAMNSRIKELLDNIQKYQSEAQDKLASLEDKSLAPA